MSSIADRHIFLYAKGYYQRSRDVVSDMKAILGERSGISRDHVNISDILVVLGHLVYSRMTEHLFFEIINRASPNNLIRHLTKDFDEMYDYYEAIIGAFLAVLLNTPSSDIPFKLGEPDPSILPLKKIDKRSVRESTYHRARFDLLLFASDHGFVFKENGYALDFMYQIGDEFIPVMIDSNSDLFRVQKPEKYLIPLSESFLRLSVFHGGLKLDKACAMIAFARWVKRLDNLTKITFDFFHKAPRGKIMCIYLKSDKGMEKIGC